MHVCANFYMKIISSSASFYHSGLGRVNQPVPVRRGIGRGGNQRPVRQQGQILLVSMFQIIYGLILP